MNSELIIDDVMIECCNWQKKRFGVLPVKSSGAITVEALPRLAQSVSQLGKRDTDHWERDSF